ncbi:hypothetical protein M440DRAFT_154753 [Trichoderma longibrachiatum ATCC 18648]|uniref:Uncharacterized protein n=1 Tax=Trichoderma longibrachiatum ATCC 18648 TaxID=983965 RepID=A0A2T4BUB4_TRILO|nr:hypothetical protein M440DRAFT_154753 [Trichoderma longibrachiatum ATCC 18648]
MHKVKESGAMPALTGQQQGLVTARASIPCPRSRSNRGPCIRKPNSTWQKTSFSSPARQPGIISWGQDTQGGCQGSWLVARQDLCATSREEVRAQERRLPTPAADRREEASAVIGRQLCKRRKTGCYSRCTMMLRTPQFFSSFGRDSCRALKPINAILS